MELTESFGFEGRTIACGRAGTGPAVVPCHGTPVSSREWTGARTIDGVDVRRMTRGRRGRPSSQDERNHET